MGRITSLNKKHLLALRLFYTDSSPSSAEGRDKKKAHIYRQVWKNTKTKNPTQCFKDFERFFLKVLSVEEREAYLKEWKIKAREDEIKEVAENIKLHKAHAEGKEESIKKFELGFLEGVKAGKRQIQKMISIVDFNTEAGQVNYLEGIATLFLKDYDDISKISFFDVENKRYISNAPVLASIINGLVDIAKLNLQKFHKSPEFAKQMLAFKRKIEEEINQ